MNSETLQEPAGDWRTWLVIGDRATGKTTFGERWAERKAREHKNANVVSVLPLAAARLCRLGLNGAVAAKVYTEATVESMKGRSFDFAWIDEPSMFCSPGSVIEAVQMSLRKSGTRLLVTTDSTSDKWLAHLKSEPGTAMDTLDRCWVQDPVWNATLRDAPGKRIWNAAFRDAVEKRIAAADVGKSSDQESTTLRRRACECGAVKCCSEIHSNWCPAKSA